MAPLGFSRGLETNPLANVPFGLRSKVSRGRVCGRFGVGLGAMRLDHRIPDCRLCRTKLRTFASVVPWPLGIAFAEVPGPFLSACVEPCGQSRGPSFHKSSAQVEALRSGGFCCPRLPRCRVGRGGAFALPPPARSNGSCSFPASRFPVRTPLRRRRRIDAGHEVDQPDKSELLHQPWKWISSQRRVSPFLGEE